MAKFTIRNQKDFTAGLLYIATGVAFSIGATFYKLGSADRMGPGYFPFWLGVLLACIGVIVTFSSVRRHTAVETLPRFDLRALAWIVGSVSLFAVLLQPMGLAVSIVALVMVSSLASHEFGWKGAILNSVLLLAVCLGAFIYGLHLQLPLWPAFFN